MNNPDFQSICIFAGSADNLDGEYHAAAAELGKLLAGQRITVIFGGGKTGLMGALANAALSAGGRVVGVVPENLFTPALIHASLTELLIAPNMHERKATMSRLAQAFIALPGGFGTFDELFETLTWSQIGIHRKPVGILNTKKYFDPMLTMIHHAQQEGFIYSNHRDLFVVAENPSSLIKRLNGFQFPSGLETWVERPTNN
ncbi:MAG: TIGR00730 family Rossman fold protein [Chloroflexota bacterium]